MRKLIFQMMVSLDGYFEGPNREIDWHLVDDEFNQYAIDLLDSVDLLIFGRVTYELMAGYWTTKDALENDPIVAGKMNSLPKIVVSRTLKSVEWNNSTLLKGNILEEVSKLKQQPGKGIGLGSSDLAVSLMNERLIDEFRIIVSPTVLGKGKPLFKGIDGRHRLKLINTRTFKTGNVLLYYQPV